MARIFSGITPSGELHIGNYLGAIKNWVELQNKHECIYCIADYHAMTEPYKPSEMQKSTLELAADLLAAGINPTKSIFFIQSHVSEHTELAWILNTITSVPELERMIQFKEMSQRFGEKANVGLFDYPVLQAADILLYKTESVPVGEDQKQHLELTRILAQRFNNRFGQTFPIPKTLLTKTPRVMSLKDPSKKMSKSLGAAHYIALTDEPEVIADKIKKAVTDTGEEAGKMSPGVANLFTLLEIFGEKKAYDKFTAEHQAGKIKYAKLKGVLNQSIADYLADFREKRKKLVSNPSSLKKTLHDGAAKAQKMAATNIQAVKAKAGLIDG